MNYIKAADTPFVFTDLVDGTLQVGDPQSLQCRFEPSELHVSAKGRLYHPIRVTRRQKEGIEQTFGLVRSQLAVILSEQMEFSTEENDDNSVGFIRWDEKLHPLKVLPPRADIAVPLL